MRAPNSRATRPYCHNSRIAVELRVTISDAARAPLQDGEGCTGGECESRTAAPVAPQQLTPEWVASVMGVPIVHTDQQRRGSFGGFASEAYRLELTYKEIGSSTEEVLENIRRQNYPTSAIVKLSSRSIDFRRYFSNVMGIELAYSTEFFAYTEIHPKLALVTVPKLYGCFPDNVDEVRQLTLAMEDLTSVDAFGNGGKLTFIIPNATSIDLVLSLRALVHLCMLKRVAWSLPTCDKAFAMKFLPDCIGGHRLGPLAEALTSCETEVVRGAAIAYDDLKRIVTDLGRMQGRSWNASILGHPYAQSYCLSSNSQCHSEYQS